MFRDVRDDHNVILFNKQYFQIKINNLQRDMCSIIPEAWNIHTVIMFQHALFVHSVAALPRLACHCASFTFVYILPSESLNGILFIKQYFQIKRTNNLQRVCIIPEAWNIQACKYFTVLWHTRGDTADVEE